MAESCREATMTTPGAIEVARLLAAMRDNGCRACAMETSSHALGPGPRRRRSFCRRRRSPTSPAIIWIITATMENYAAAKARLFECSMKTPSRS